ncbi:hypothetical protein [Providencia huaxiensis]|uniref:hypothetical protein n=1 Tax=Providencia huaxiensis TaxID=2027290 RepID=UPI0032DA651C
MQVQSQHGTGELTVITVKTNELTGIALDWAVTEAIGEQQREDAYRKKYSSDWRDCGTLLERFRIDVHHEIGGWLAHKDLGFIGAANDLKIAICLAIVGWKFGDEVQIPASLQES